MKLKSLKIENFRAIKHIELKDLTDTVISVMATKGHQPEGMRQVIQKIIDA